MLTACKRFDRFRLEGHNNFSIQVQTKERHTFKISFHTNRIFFFFRFVFHGEDEKEEAEEEKKLIYNTMEPEALFAKAYPALSIQFEQREEEMKKKKAKVPPGKKKATEAKTKTNTETTTTTMKETKPNIECDLVSIEEALKKMNLKPESKIAKKKKPETDRDVADGEAEGACRREKTTTTTTKTMALKTAGEKVEASEAEVSPELQVKSKAMPKDDVDFDDLIQSIETKGEKSKPRNKTCEEKEKKKKKKPSTNNPTLPRNKPIFTISSSSSSSSEGESESSPSSLVSSKSNKPSTLPSSPNHPALNAKVGKEQKRRMSFFQIKQLEDSLNVELERRIDLNQSVRRERDDVSDDDFDEDNQEADVDRNHGLHDDENLAKLTFDLSYGNFSFQTSINEAVTPLKLSTSENIAQSRQSLHSTPYEPAKTKPSLNSPEMPDFDLSPEQENRPVFDSDLSLDCSPLPLRERLKRGLL